MPRARCARSAASITATPFLTPKRSNASAASPSFAKQAVLDCGGTITLLDTPGHVDFSAEAERTLQVLDYAILVISGTDGVQGHTRTLWRLLERYGVPTFLFINKMDLCGRGPRGAADGSAKELRRVRRSRRGAERARRARRADRRSGSRGLLERGALSDDTLAALISARKNFPLLLRLRAQK